MAKRLQLSAEKEFYYGRVAYNTYCDSRHWKSVKGDLLPDFDHQERSIQIGWELAAQAVIGEFVLNNVDDGK